MRQIWNARRSVTLSIAATIAGIVCAVAVAPSVPTILKLTLFSGSYRPSTGGWEAILVPLYGCLVAGIIAEVLLLRTLMDIRRDRVFTPDNVRRLRGISWCGFAIAIICAVAAMIIEWPRATFVLVGVLAAFMALIMRVVKNVIDAARILKEDSEYTI